MIVSADVPSLAREIEGRFLDAASAWDTEQRVPDAVIDWVADRGLFGAQLPAEAGGAGLGPQDVTRLFEALGAVSGSLGSIVNVQHMVTSALARGATEAQKARWLPQLARGQHIAAFCVTEAGAGSDMRAMEAKLVPEGDGVRLCASKRWITTGARADTFLVICQQDNQGAAVLVPKDTPGIEVTPIPDLLGLRSAFLAAVSFDCVLPEEAVVGRKGFGFALVAAEGLTQGRLNVARMACGALDAMLRRLSVWVLHRKTFGVGLVDRGQVQQALTRLGVDLLAARALTRQAAEQLADGDAGATEAVLAAKYFATRAQSAHVATAVRLHGALGCHEPNALPRYLRDAAVFEVVEGASEVIEMVLGQRFAREWADGDR